MLMRMPVYLVLAALAVGIVVGAVCVMAGRRMDAEISRAVPPPRWDDTHYPPP